MVYPSIYEKADQAASKYQSAFFRSLLLQYALLIIASAMTVGSNPLAGKTATSIYLASVLLATALAFLNIYLRRDSRWYFARALAESIKTLSWRYAMQCPPFNASKEGEPERAFAESVQAALSVQPKESLRFLEGESTDNQISSAMQEIRGTQPCLTSAPMGPNRVIC